MWAGVRGNRLGELISTSCYTPWRLEIDEVKRQRVSVSNMISGGDSDGVEWLTACTVAIDSCFFWQFRAILPSCDMTMGDR